MPNREDRPTDAPAATPQRSSSPDPADYGTAFGLEMSFDPTKSGAPLDAEAEEDPVAWIRRWVAQHKPT